ncbi:MAG: alpha/beta hydrolase family protein [Candidatus Izemoplasmatales bacterium]
MILILTVILYTGYTLIYEIRWQLIILYILVTLMMVVVFIKMLKNIILRPIISKLLVIVLVFLTMASMTALLVFPLYEIPKPTGPYSIGTQSMIIEDLDRIDLYGENSTEYRRFKIQFWYPAESTETYQRAPWLEDGKTIARGLSKDLGFPFFLLDHTALIESNSYEKAPISTDFIDYPVLIISHGWRGFRNLHTDFAEELASYGFIVIAIDHTYGSVATVFDDEVIYLNPKALPDREDTTDFILYANQLVDTYAGDIKATIDYLENLNQDQTSIFYQKLDLSALGHMGHSTGGGAGVSLALEDSRIKSLIGLDAWVEPIESSKIDLGLSIPSLFLRSEMWEIGLNNLHLMSLKNQSQYVPSIYQINGTTHYDFAMVYMYSPLTKLIGFRGDLDKNYLNQMLKTMIVHFFKENLINDSNPPLNYLQWDEVEEIK